MKSIRLFVPFRLLAERNVALESEQARYINRVMRLRSGDSITLFDGHGDEYPAEITSVGKQRVEISVGKKRSSSVESTLGIHLVQGISRGERMDLVVQKATELGVNRITPVIADRSVVRLDSERGRKRQHHWTRIAQSACEQCGRNFVPQIDAPLSLADWFAQVNDEDVWRLVLSPDATSRMRESNAVPGNLLLLIGPEGGLSDKELEHAVTAGFQAVSMGPRVLRTETAAIAAIAVMQSKFGDVG